jgi:alpha-tubulin suppressor-like RCC1 family protein
LRRSLAGVADVGNGGTASSSVPVVVSGTAPGQLCRIAAGYSYACAALAGGTVRCWGNNLYGELGNGTILPSSFAVPVGDPAGAPLTGVAAVSAGVFTACALGAAGGVSCWGLNTLGPSARGLLGDNDTSSELSALPVTVVARDGLTPMAGATTVAVGDVHACARVQDGSVACWGDNTNGQLGDGGGTWSPVPVTVRVAGGAPLSGAAGVSTGSLSSCALLQAGHVACWGDDFYGQLGDDGSADAPVAVDVRFP